VREPVGEVVGGAVGVVPSADGLVVDWRGVEPDWQPRRGALPGTAVMWRDQPFEAVARMATPEGSRWVLRPWPENEAMRTVTRLDDEAVGAARHRAAEERGARLRRLMTLPLLPVLGLVPGEMQERWRLDWGHPTEAAVLLSTLLELAVGSVGLLQAMVMVAGSGEWLLPPWLQWLAVVGPLLCLEAVLRATLLVSHGQATGSLLAAPLALLSRDRIGAERAASEGVRPVRGPSLLTLTVRIAYASMAWRERQERWATELGLRAIWLTVLGAAAELVGGLVNLARHGGEGVPLLWLDLFFVIEGAVRLLSLAASGRPVGSLLALPFEPLVDRLERRRRGPGGRHGSC